MSTEMKNILQSMNIAYWKSNFEVLSSKVLQNYCGDNAERFRSVNVVATFSMLRAPSPIHMELPSRKTSRRTDYMRTTRVCGRITRAGVS